MRHCSLQYRSDWFQVKNEDSNSLYSTHRAMSLFPFHFFYLFIYYFLARVNVLISPKMPVPELQHKQASLSSDTHDKKKKKKQKTPGQSRERGSAHSVFALLYMA